MNKLDQLFLQRQRPVLNMYCTAGFPSLESTTEVMLSLQRHGADIIEVGIPYSDPVADGPVIQQSNMQALANGISIQKIFEQLYKTRDSIKIPVILMGYLNPVLQYGIRRFCEDAEAAGISGIILPDLPMHEYETLYKDVFKEHGLHVIFLVTPVTSEQRIRKADKLSGGFLYAVSSSATTGQQTSFAEQEGYFKGLQEMKLKNPVLIGFGIRDKATFDAAAKHASGAIIGSAYIKALQSATDIDTVTRDFINSIKNN
ncbi:tryptophan synthase subunit alpha [Ferruginibacter sp. HRS2-29]|uniref:tryptophan synthase subunit alpha n=1 Tax=Ferruginibacter sp. HRS2-29 TaxID=2487334 RepID=UPI0020CCF569|nr:tryptophan synthase subunit alpha [Ferruginibacter sp. HRS2-29]MCP9752475.1 tryptophan synthase subunit alpha [Ferruginibacter sp. HRS2-29]